ncbi:MAG: tRNA-intron lyase [Asgard group archaeon]|nr:tRNA-intron lyase [Asgard group archaeon]
MTPNNKQDSAAFFSIQINAELVDDRVIIWNYEEGSHVYANGFFGKPIGIRKPKTNQFERPLKLTLIESCYLLKYSNINIYDGKSGKQLDYESVYSIGLEKIPQFEEKLLVYEDIRKRDLVPRPGLKFGADFAVYKKGPGLDHSPYVITAMPRGSELTARDLVRAGRLATSVRKKFVIATILPNNKVRYYGFPWYKP